jgi:hypothetical protein
MVGPWGDGDVGREGIFLLAGSAVREMSVLSVCSVTFQV